MHSYSTIGGMHHHESTDRNSKSINALILSSFPWIKIPWIKRGKNNNNNDRISLLDIAPNEVVGYVHYPKEKMIACYSLLLTRKT